VQTLRFVFAPEAGQIDRVHHIGKYPTPPPLSKIVHTARPVSVCADGFASLIIGHV